MSVIVNSITVQTNNSKHVRHEGKRKQRRVLIFAHCDSSAVLSNDERCLLLTLTHPAGVLARKNPYCAVEVMDIVRDLLPPLINAQQLAYPQQAGKEGTAKSYTVVVESSHPYKPASVCQYKVRVWMIGARWIHPKG